VPKTGAMTAAGRTLGIASLCALLLVRAASTDAAAYESEAALIFKIGKFVSWPAGTFANSRTTLRLCIVGTDAGAEDVDSLAGQKLQEKVISIARLSIPEQSASECHIVFIRKSERDRLPAILGALARSPVLTISDIEGFAAEGGMIGFTATDGRIHFEINAAASKRAGLTIGAQLLQIAALSGDERADSGP